MTIESAVITVLLYDESSSFYIPQLNLKDFIEPLNRQTFEVIKKLYQKGEKIDFVKVAKEMSFGEEFLKTYEINYTFHLLNMPDYITKLKQETAKRELKNLLHDGQVKVTMGADVTNVINSVMDSLNQIETIPNSKLVDVGDIEPTYENSKRIVSGFSNLDKMIGGFKLGELSVWSGKSGQGKSTFLSQIMLEVINKGYKACAYSGELINEQFQHWLLLQACGYEHLEKKYEPIRHCDVYVPNKDSVSKIRAWLKGKFFLYNNQFTGNDNNILEVFRYAYKAYDCRVFLVDNLMTARYDYNSRENYYIQQSRFVGELVRFAKTYDVHVHLIAHPKKTQGEITKEDISGSLDITNRADNAFTVNRLDDGTTEVKILKNRSEGIQNQFVKFNFDTFCKRFTPLNNDFAKYKKYGWENEEVIF